jgi:hypothetical protein
MHLGDSLRTFKGLQIGMKTLKQLFQRGWTAASNPGQEERVAVIVDAIERELPAKKAAFNLKQMLEPIDCTNKDVEVANRTSATTPGGTYGTSGTYTISHRRQRR